MAENKTEKDRKVIQKVSDAYRASKDDTYRQFKELVWNRCLNAWRGKLSKIIPRKSNLFIPITFQTVETMIARELSAIFNDSGKLYKFKARKEEHMKAAETITEFANFDFYRIPNVYRKWRRERTHVHIYGTAFFRVFWDFQYVLDEKNKLNVFRDQFNIDNVSPRNFFPDPVAKSLDECRYVITRSLIDKEEFKDMLKRVEYSRLTPAEVDQIAVQGGIGYEEDFSELDHRDSLTLDKNRKFIEVMEYWSVPNDEYLVVAGGKFVVRNDKIPFKHKKYPFVMDVDIPEAEEFWGIATVELIHDLQAELNSIRNNRMDKWNYITNPMWKARQSSMFDRRELISRPGGVVRLKDMSDLERLPMGETKQSDYIEEQTTKTDIQNASSISDFSQGFNQGGGNDTATGISIISSNADAKIITKLQYTQEEFIKPLGLLWIHLQQQFGKVEEVFFVTGEQWQLENQMLFHSYDLSVLASTQLVNKTVKQNQMVQLSQVALGSPHVNQKEWIKLMFETYGLDTNKLIVKAPTGIPQIPGLTNTQGAGQADPNAANQASPLGSPQGRDFIQGKDI